MVAGKVVVFLLVVLGLVHGHDKVVRQASASDETTEVIPPADPSNPTGPQTNPQPPGNTDIPLANPSNPTGPESNPQPPENSDIPLANPSNPTGPESNPQPPENSDTPPANPSNPSNPAGPEANPPPTENTDGCKTETVPANGPSPWTAFWTFPDRAIIKSVSVVNELSTPPCVASNYVIRGRRLIVRKGCHAELRICPK